MARMGGRRGSRSWRIALGASVMLAAAGIAPLSTNAAAAVDCSAQVNDTVDKLIPCITKADLMTHLQKFQDIADANPGPDGHPSRNSGEPGYKASVDYVKAKMQAAGYNVTIQTYTFPYFAFTAIPTFSEVSPTARTFVLDTDFTAGQAAGTVTGAQVQPAGGIVIPPTATPSSASGCTAADFAGFVAGRVALVQRGTCTFGTKALNAQAAGASGIIVFNEGNPGRTGIFSGSLVDAAGNQVSPKIPVIFTPFDLGKALLTEYQAGSNPTVSIDVKGVSNPAAPDYNVIAESKGGDKNHVVVVDAHLDAIYGAGILDNATGSAAILDIAEKMKNVTPRNKLRFIWFGGEELGLIGSNFYINSLSSNELSHIGYDLDADVLGTPNYVAGVLDPAGVELFTRGPGTTFPNKVYKASTVARDQAISYLDSIGVNNELFSPDGTDAFVFNQAGIPASGVLTGQNCCKTAGDVALFGGQTGNFEGNLGTTDGGCVDTPFRWCDNITNVDPKVMTFMSRAFGAMVVQMAFDTNVMSASNNSVIKPKPSPHGSRKFPAR
jgi:Zn-dependent M28 family amino/carboxypeptidase